MGRHLALTLLSHCSAFCKQQTVLATILISSFAKELVVVPTEESAQHSSNLGSTHNGFLHDLRCSKIISNVTEGTTDKPQVIPAET